MRNDTGSRVSSTTSEQIAGAEPAARAWVQPRLVRVGTVAQLTAKIDWLGRNDGGSFPRFRT